MQHAPSSANAFVLQTHTNRITMNLAGLHNEGVLLMPSLWMNSDVIQENRDNIIKNVNYNTSITLLLAL